MHGETDKALDAISDVGVLSAYGRMQQERISAICAIQRHDDKELDVHLDYMRQHKIDALGTYEEVLLDANRIDAAAALLIERLHAADERSDALLSMQRYVGYPEPPFMQTRRERWRSVIARPDVQSALAGVGRIEQAPLDEPGS
jgi:hypothetical protein